LTLRHQLPVKRITMIIENRQRGNGKQMLIFDVQPSEVVLLNIVGKLSDIHFQAPDRNLDPGNLSWWGVDANKFAPAKA
jgi:hypothetical protein